MHACTHTVTKFIWFFFCFWFFISCWLQFFCFSFTWNCFVYFVCLVLNHHILLVGLSFYRVRIYVCERMLRAIALKIDFFFQFKCDFSVYAHSFVVDWCGGIVRTWNWNIFAKNNSKSNEHKDNTKWLLLHFIQVIWLMSCC